MLGLSDDFLSTSPSGLGGGIILGSASEVCVTMAIGARERALRVLAEEHPPPQTDSTDGAAAGPSNAAKASKPDEELDPEVTVSKQVDGNGNAPRAPAARVAASATVLANSALSKWRGNLTSRLVMYGTTQTHSIAAKAAIILGLDFRALEVTKEDGFALRGATLRAALLEDQSVGRVPFMLVASLGTTSSGAVDNVQEITEVARDFPSLWVHVDAAYAGVALALPELREQCYSDALCHVDSSVGADFVLDVSLRYALTRSRGFLLLYPQLLNESPQMGLGPIRLLASLPPRPWRLEFGPHRHA